MLAAVADAGLSPTDVDGLTTFTMETNSEIEVARTAGLGDLTFFSKIGYGGGAACATVQQAAMAVATGVADVVVCYRAFNERSRPPLRLRRRTAASRPPRASRWAGCRSFGLMTPASWVAMFAQRYMHEYGATSEDFGRGQRRRPQARGDQPQGLVLRAADHARGPPEQPLDRRARCTCSTAARRPTAARPSSSRRPSGPATCPTPPARHRRRRAGLGPRPAVDGQLLPRRHRAGCPRWAWSPRQLWEQSGIGPDDIQTAVIYDHFTPFVLQQLEEFGFCKRGEAKDFIAGGAIELGGRLPVNTHGGQLGEAYLHGMNGIAEGVRQVRGTSVNQVPDVENVLVTAGTGVPTSGLVLSADR